MSDRMHAATVVRGRITSVTIARANGTQVTVEPSPPINVSPTDIIAVERGTIVVRHGKRHRVTARVNLPPAVSVKL